MKLSFQLGQLNLSVGAERSPAAPLRRSAQDSPIQAWMKGEEGTFANDTPYLASPFQQSIWVYTAVCALAQTVSAIPFRISQGERSGENLMTKGPVVDLFNRPHKLLNRFRFWEFIVTWYCLRGEAFIVGLDKFGSVLPIKNQKSKIENLLVLSPDQFRHIVEDSELLGWNFQGSSFSSPLHSMALTPDEVIHDFFPNPYLFWRGLSPLSVAMLAAQTDFASAQFMKGLMLNNADAGLIVRSDDQMAPEQRECLLASLRERKRRAGTADRPLLLWGTTEVIQPTLSSADLQFLENRKMNRQEICAAFFRIPQSLVGFTENANRSISESERLNFMENSVTPLCARLEAAIEPVVKAFGPDLVGWFDVESTAIMQQARRSRVETGVKLFSVGYPINVINKTLDLGLPHVPWGNQGFLQGSTEPLGQLPEKPEQKEKHPVFDRLYQLLKAPDASNSSGEAKESRPEAEQNPEPAHNCRSAPLLKPQFKTGVQKKTAKLRAFFFDQRKRVLSKLKDGPSVELSSLFDTNEETKRLVTKIKALQRADIELGFREVAMELALQELEMPEAKVQSVVQKAEPKWHDLNLTTFKELERAVQQRATVEEASETLIQKIKDIFQDASDRRAEPIAESQTHSDLNSGRFMAMQEAGVQSKAWRTAGDDRVRPAHRQAEADYAEGIPIDEPFIVGGEALMYPGDPSGSIGNTINCRCVTVPV